MAMDCKKIFLSNRKFVNLVLTFIVVSLLTESCGYHNPNMAPLSEQGPPIHLYIPLWSNPTAEVGLESQIHNALSDWFIQYKRITLTNNKEDADYLLTGSVVSIRFPGRSHTATEEATALKAVLTVSFKMEDTKDGFIVLERKGMTLEETYSIGAGSAGDDENKKTAIQTMTDNLAEQVYIRTLLSLRRYEKRKKE